MEQLGHPHSYSQHVIGQGKSLHCHCKQATSGPEHIKETVPAVQILLKSLYLTLSIDINFQY